jgi:hypothetical protein
MSILSEMKPTHTLKPLFFHVGTGGFLPSGRGLLGYDEVQ